MRPLRTWWRLVGGEDSSAQYSWQPPTTVLPTTVIPHGATIKGRATLVVSAERGGLYANVTRIVDLEEPEGELQQRQDACEAILKLMREATRPGQTLAGMSSMQQEEEEEPGLLKPLFLPPPRCAPSF